MKYKAITWALIILTVSLAVWGLDRAGEFRWSGDFALTVRIEPTPARQIARASACTMQRREWAQIIRDDIRHADCVLRPVSEIRDGSILTVMIPFGVNISGLGRERHYGEDQLLILKLEYAGGEEEFKVIEIPEGRGGRTVRVDIR